VDVVDDDAGTFTYTWTDPTGGAAGDVVVRAGVTQGDELQGILAAVDDSSNVTTYHNISRSTYPIWKANVLQNSGTLREITEDLMQQAVDKCLKNGGSEPNKICSGLAVRRKYIALQVAAKRFTTSELRGGHVMLDFNGIPYDVDVDCPPERLLFLNTERFTHYHVGEGIQWIDEDGNILHRSATKDAFEARMVLHPQLCCDRPNANALIEDISES